MPAGNDALKDRLSRYRGIKITVTGRNSGRAISIPVWFVLDHENLYLLPVQGSDTQWYKNVLNSVDSDQRAGRRGRIQHCSYHRLETGVVHHRRLSNRRKVVV